MSEGYFPHETIIRSAGTLLVGTERKRVVLEHFRVVMHYHSHIT